MHSALRDDRGFSLTELMVVATLLVVVMGAAWTAFLSLQASADSIQARAAAQDESQRFMSRITSELRQARNPAVFEAGTVPNIGVFANVGARSVTFYADLDRNGLPERINYRVPTGTSSLVRTQAVPTNSTYPYSFGTTSTPLVMIQTVDPGWAGAIFEYFSPPLSTTTSINPVAQSNIPSMTIVSIAVKNRQKSGTRTVNYLSESSARIRSIGNGY